MSSTKENKPLADNPFDFSETRDGRVTITYHGKRVTSLAGRQAARFVCKMEGLRDNAERQLLMAKVTGNFKRGNERASRNAK